MDWMIAGGIGSVLAGVGLRVRGEVASASPDSPDGIVETPPANGSRRTPAPTAAHIEPSCALGGSSVNL